MEQLTAEQVRHDLLDILKQVRDDWNYSIEVNENTGVFRELGFESIDAVALGATLEEHFNRSLPFAQFLTRVREQNLPDITVGLLLGFLLESLNGSTNGRGA
jgi:acyl carrier protein